MLEKITENVEIHQTLPDVPSMTAQELKKEWDKGNKIIKAAFNKLVDELNNNMFPIGFRMFVNNDKDYSKHLGFTWQKVAKGRVLVGKNENDTDFNSIGKKGGEKKHKQTIAEMPSHNHSTSQTEGLTLQAAAENSGGNSGIGITETNGFPWAKNIASQGGGQAFNVMQPYEVVNIWERIL